MPLGPLALRIPWRLLLAIALVAPGCGSPADAPASPLAQAGQVRTLGVPGADNRGVALASAGAHVVATWTATMGNVTNVYAAVSRDGGLSFSSPTRVNQIDGDARVSGEQAPRVAIGRNVVVLWQSRAKNLTTIRLARSTDEGATFQPATTIHSEGLAGTRGWASLTLDARDTAHAVWLDARPQGQSSTASMPAAAGHVHAAHKSTQQNVYHAAIAPDGSRTERLVARDVCFCCKTASTATTDGVVYAAWRHLYPPNFRDMAVARSANFGTTFGSPTRVSEDGWAIDGCPEDGPSMAADARGVLHIVWPTIATGEITRKAIYYSYSSDGGTTFARRVQLDSGASARTPAHPQVTLVGSKVVVTWDEGEGDARTVVMRAIESSTSPAWTPRLGPIARVAAGEFVSYPAVAATPTGALVAWSTAEGADSMVQIAGVTW